MPDAQSGVYALSVHPLGTPCYTARRRAVLRAWGTIPLSHLKGELRGNGGRARSPRVYQTLDQKKPLSAHF